MFIHQQIMMLQKNIRAVVIAHPNGGVKEQASGLYAQRTIIELMHIQIQRFFIP